VVGQIVEKEGEILLGATVVRLGEAIHDT
jgi:hypothetical protein